MAIFEFKYTNLDGEDRIVERRFRMSEMPDVIEVEENGVLYLARRIISLTAGKHSSWQVLGLDSDLPPENFQFPSESE